MAQGVALGLVLSFKSRTWLKSSFYHMFLPWITASYGCLVASNLMGWYEITQAQQDAK